MNEQTPDTESAPGAGAGDAAPTQQIPHVPAPVKKSVPTKSAAARAVTPAKKAAATKPETDKGRVRPAPAPAPEARTSDSKSATTEVSAKQHGTRTGKGSAEPSGRPLSAANYARTTNRSASTTAVIPAVKPGTCPDTEAAREKPSDEPGPRRRASLRLVHVEPWSVTRLAFAISVAMMIVGVVAVTIFWVVLDAAGVWTQINNSVTNVLSDNSSSFDITDYLGVKRMVGLTLVLTAINVVLMTALATIGAHLYNLAAQLLGGVEVTFAEEN